MEEKKKYVIDYKYEALRIIGIIFGSFIFAYAINALYRPNGFLSTGFNGISQMLNELLGWSLAVCSFVLNMIVVIIGFKLISKRFAIYSILGITFSALFLDVTDGWILPVDEPLIAVIFGGLILGVGVGIAIRCGGAIGGMNILGRIINKYFGISIGSVDMYFNIVIIAVAALLFDLNMAMYTILARFVATRAIDSVIEGVNRKKAVIIVSDKAEEIAKELLNKKNVGRGVTFLEGEGAYSRQSKRLIYCVVSLTQMGKVKSITHGTDPSAFITILDAKEVLGRGFTPKH